MIFAVPAVLPSLEVHSACTVDVDGRGVSAALVKEIHNAFADEVERRGAGGARIVKIRYPKVGGDGCVAGGATIVEI